MKKRSEMPLNESLEQAEQEKALSWSHLVLRAGKLPMDLQPEEMLGRLHCAILD